jgi:hypothetical protein
VPELHQLTVELPWPLHVGDLVGQDITISGEETGDEPSGNVSVARTYRVAKVQPSKDREGWVIASLVEERGR